MSFLDKLLNVLWSRSTSPCLIHAAARKHRHDRKHLSTCVELQDREKVCVVVSQHVARHGDGVLAILGPLQGLQAGLLGRFDANLQAGSVMVFQVRFHLLLQLGIMRSVLVQPEDGWSARGSGPGDGELHPVLNRNILGLARAPDVPGSHLGLQQNLAGGIDDLHRAGLLHLEGLVMRPVLLCLLGHQSNIWNGAHSAGVESSVFLAKLYNSLKNTCVAAVRDKAFRVLQLVILVPHLAAVSDHCRHGSINDDIAGHMQVRDSLVRVHHCQSWLDLVRIHDGCFNLGLLLALLQLLVQVIQSEVGVHTQGLELRLVLCKNILEVDADNVPKKDRVADLHHGGLQVQGQHYVLSFRIIDLLLQIFPELDCGHGSSIQNLSLHQR
mmetsp:Transcript_20933/g.49692  ORF Transcript_20933/g.49692 Transcript_20933/m.49692 type:complete len:383 (-) Transcript_20933:685-1833(-)